MTASAATPDAGGIAGWGDQMVALRSELTDLVAIAAGATHSVGRKSDGSVVAWGWNLAGQCNKPVPNGGFAAATGGSNHSLGLRAERSIVVWRNNLC